MDYKEQILLGHLERASREGASEPKEALQPLDINNKGSPN